MGAQVWESRVRGRHHRVEATDAGLSKQVEWYVDDALVAERRTADEKFELASDDLGSLRLRFTKLGRGRRATWVTDDGEQVDLAPAAGSPADRHEQELRDHPRRHQAKAVAGSIAGILLPILLGAIAVRFAFSLPLPWPDWRLPDLPGLPLPDLPDLPVPDIDLPDWSLPGWLAGVLDAVKYVVIVLVAFFVARAEVRRRRQQDELSSQEADDRPRRPGDPPADA